MKKTKFSYYCDPSIKWIDVSENVLIDNHNDYETNDTQKAIAFAKTYNYPFVGYSDTESAHARMLNEKVKLDVHI